ncbi:MAG: hypothetical protein SCK28_15810, partial [Bacillota bacterium]|nr:hypothetical protein [Bacillota bacterium]
MNLAANRIRALIIFCILIGTFLGTFVALDQSDLLFAKEPIDNQQVLQENDTQTLILKETIARASRSNHKLTAEELAKIANNVYLNSEDFQMDYQLILAVIEQESHFRINAVSPKGAL